MLILPPELLHDTVHIVIGACIDNILGRWWKYTEDSADTRLIQGAPSNEFRIWEVPSDNPINALLSTSSQIRFISLRILSRLLDIALDETGIGSLQTSPWSRINDAQTIMKGSVLAESARTAWAESAAAVQHLPCLLRQYITMFILELHFKDRRIQAKNLGALAKVLLFHKSTESELYKELPDLFDTTGKSAPGRGYVVARYLRFNVLKSCHQFNVSADTLNWAVGMTLFIFKHSAGTTPRPDDEVKMGKDDGALIASYTRRACSQYSELSESISAALSAGHDFRGLGTNMMQKSIKTMEELRNHKRTTSPEETTELYIVLTHGVELLQTALADSVTAHSRRKMAEQDSSLEASNAMP